MSDSIEDQILTAIRGVLDSRGWACGPDHVTDPQSKEITRLRAAIRQHRSDIWGDGDVGHPADVELYAAAFGREEGHEPASERASDA